MRVVDSFQGPFGFLLDIVLGTKEKRKLFGWGYMPKKIEYILKNLPFFPSILFSAYFVSNVKIRNFKNVFFFAFEVFRAPYDKKRNAN